MKKSYNQKLNDTTKHNEIIQMPFNMAEKWQGKMLIARPIEYNNIMKKVPYGKVITTEYMREHLAKKHGADFTCPLTCGIFVNIVAKAADERDDKEFPYWRTVKSKGELCEKFPGGLEGHKALLEREGHIVVAKGKKYFVVLEGKLYTVN